MSPLSNAARVDGSPPFMAARDRSSSCSAKESTVLAAQTGRKPSVVVACPIRTGSDAARALETETVANTPNAYDRRRLLSTSIFIGPYADIAMIAGDRRSEERRVGKEG